MIGQLTNHLWQSTAFGLAVAVLTFFFRKSGAHVRYGLWFSASIKFFLPFAFLIALGRQLEWAPAVREAASPAVSATMVRISEPFFEATPAVLPVTPASRRTIGWIAIVLPAIWACGSLTIALIRVRLWRRIRIIVRASTPLTLPGIETPPGLQIRVLPPSNVVTPPEVPHSQQRIKEGTIDEDGVRSRTMSEGRFPNRRPAVTSAAFRSNRPAWPASAYPARISVLDAAGRNCKQRSNSRCPSKRCLQRA
jgi:hypothetical protein